VKYGKKYVYSYAVTEFGEGGSDREVAEEESNPFEEGESPQLIQNFLDQMMREEW